MYTNYKEVQIQDGFSPKKHYLITIFQKILIKTSIWFNVPEQKYGKNKGKYLYHLYFIDLFTKF